MNVDSRFFSVLRIRIRDPVVFWPLDPGSGIPGSLTHIFESFVTTFWVKSSKNFWKLVKFVFFNIKKMKYFAILWKLWLQKKGKSTNFFSPFSFIAVFGSGIRDLGSGMGKNQDPGCNTYFFQLFCILAMPRCWRWRLRLSFRQNISSA